MDIDRARHLRRKKQPAQADCIHIKKREIYLSDAADLQKTVNLLSNFPGLKVSISDRKSLLVCYHLGEYSLEKIESLLLAHGFCLDDSWLMRVSRWFAYFSENTEIHNIEQPERLLKQSNQIYSTIWDEHLHGDEDKTPEDLRKQG